MTYHGRFAKKEPFKDEIKIVRETSGSCIVLAVNPKRVLGRIERSIIGKGYRWCFLPKPTSKYGELAIPNDLLIKITEVLRKLYHDKIMRPDIENV